MIDIFEIIENENDIKILYQDIKKALSTDDITALNNYIAILEDKKNISINNQNIIAGMFGLHVSHFNAIQKGRTITKDFSYNDEFIKIAKQALKQYTERSLMQEWENMQDEMQKIVHQDYDPFSEKAAQQTIETLKSILPLNHIKPNNKLANEITRDFINEGEITLRVSPKDGIKEATTKAVLTYEDKNISLSGRTKFTPYDRVVHDAVVTLYDVGNDVITPDMVYRAMNGMTETEKVSPQAVGSVTRSLDKSRRIMVNINCSQEVQFYKKNCKVTYEGYLLACDKVTVTVGGHTKEAYKLLRKPILYEYAQISGQILNVPIKLLQTKSAVRSTDEVMVIRDYLIRQIEGMKSPAFKRNNNIKFDGIYEELDITLNTISGQAYKDKTGTIRKHVMAILKAWKHQGYVKEYSQYKEGKTIRGITVIPQNAPV